MGTSRAIMIMLFRPYVLSRPKDPVDAAQSSCRIEATQKTRAAANNVNNLLEEIMSLDLVEFISPAMSAHLTVTPCFAIQ